MYELIDKNGNISANSANVIVIDKNGLVKQVGTGGGGSPTGPAGGDLSGTYPNPSVVWANGQPTYDLIYYPLPTGTVSQYIDGTGAFQTFPTIPTVGTWGALNYPTWTTGTPFVKMTAAGTFALDTNTYITTANAALQNAYDNSTNGTIILDNTRGGIKVKGIIGTTNIIECYAAGQLAPEFYVDSVCNVIGKYIYGTWFNVAYNTGFQDNTGTVKLKPQYDGIVGQGRWETNQRINYLADYSSLYSSRSLIDKGYADSTYVPNTRTLTINGVTYDLTADRSWTIATSSGTVTSVAALTLGTSGTDLSSTVANGTTTPVITLNVPTASATNRGALSSADWTTFNNKQNASTRKNANNSTNNNINYCGVALGTGVSESSAVWTITRLTIAASGSITTATATNVAWTNRESAIYI